MASWSKMKPGAEEVSCSALAHPWTQSCLLAAADLFLASCIGSASFFSLINFCQYVSMIVKRKKKVNFQDFLRMTIRSSFFGASTAAGTIAASCFFRNLFGRYYHHTFVFIPALIGGLSINLESRNGKEIATNTFANCVLESWTKRLQDAKILTWTPIHQTMIFMILSSALSSLLGGTNYHQRYFWFFIPPQVGEGESKNICFHKGDCWKYVLELFIKYSTTGLVLHVVRLFVANIKKPKSFFCSLRTPKIFKLAAFLGTYVFVYQSVKCFFYRKEKRSSLVHDALAGFLAGTAFRFQPALPIFNSALITIVQVLMEIGCRRKFLPNISYLETVFVLCCGLLFHERLVFGDKCPQVVIYILSAITHKRVDATVQNFQRLCSKTKNLS